MFFFCSGQVDPDTVVVDMREKPKVINSRIFMLFCWKYFYQCKVHCGYKLRLNTNTFLAFKFLKF